MTYNCKNTECKFLNEFVKILYKIGEHTRFFKFKLNKKL